MQVKSELKHMDEEALTYLQLERIAQLVQFPIITTSKEEEIVRENTSSKNIVVSLISAPIKPLPAGSENNDSSAAV